MVNFRDGVYIFRRRVEESKVEKRYVSNTEAEYMAASEGAKETIWLTRLLSELITS